MSGFRVLHVLNSAGGGSAISTVALIETLKKQGIHGCAVCDDRGTDDERQRLTAAVDGKVAFTPLYWWNRKIRTALWKRPILELLQLIRTGWRFQSAAKVQEYATKWRPNLIHTNTLLTPEGGIAARKLGLPHVWHLRELVGPGAPFRIRLDGKSLGSFLLRHADRIVANSTVAAAPLANMLPQEFLTVVPNGIDCAAFAGARQPLTNDPIVIGMVASLSSRVKKHELFIRAAAQVKADRPIQWRIYGHDPSHGGRIRGDAYIDSLLDLARELGVIERLQLPGHLPPEQIMNEIDILVHPTDVESFGRVVVEAMAASRPVVGANGGGVADIVKHQDTGFLAQPDDADAFARAIEKLVQNPAMARQYGLNGRVEAEAKYQIDVCVKRIRGVYDEVIASRAAPNGISKTTAEGAASATLRTDNDTLGQLAK